MLITKIAVDIWKRTAALIFSSGELLTTFSKNMGAKEKFRPTLFRWDYFLKMVTGKETFKIFFLWMMFDPIWDIIYLNTFFWWLICYSFVHITPPLLCNFHSLNKGCSVRNLLTGLSLGSTIYILLNSPMFIVLDYYVENFLLLLRTS
mgnify:CR=1 FL=1